MNQDSPGPPPALGASVGPGPLDHVVIPFAAHTPRPCWRAHQQIPRLMILNAIACDFALELWNAADVVGADRTGVGTGLQNAVEDADKGA